MAQIYAGLNASRLRIATGVGLLDQNTCSSYAFHCKTRARDYVFDDPSLAHPMAESLGQNAKILSRSHARTIKSGVAGSHPARLIIQASKGLSQYGSPVLCFYLNWRRGIGLVGGKAAGREPLCALLPHRALDQAMDQEANTSIGQYFDTLNHAFNTLRRRHRWRGTEWFGCRHHLGARWLLGASHRSRRNDWWWLPVCWTHAAWFYA